MNFAQAVAKELVGQEVEIYLGDSKNTLKLAEYDHSLKNIIQGKIVKSLGDCLVLDVEGTKVYLNCWSIKTIVPISDKMFIKDIFVDEHKGFNGKLRK